MIFDGILLLTDLDGTFLNDLALPVDENYKAVEYFIKNGGSFSVATGRPPISVKEFFPNNNINFPGIVFNGACLYDFKENCYIYENKPSSEVLNFVLDAYSVFPQAGLVVYTDEDMYTPKRCFYSEIMEKFEKGNFNEKKSIDELPFTAIKYLFICEHKTILEIKKYLEEKAGDKIQITSSLDGFLEVLAPDTNKGTALLKLKELYKNKIKNIYSIGDYYNDLPILINADIKAVVKGAPDDLQKISDYVTVKTNNEGAVADLIYNLENILKKRVKI